MANHGSWKSQSPRCKPFCKPNLCKPCLIVCTTIFVNLSTFEWFWKVAKCKAHSHKAWNFPNIFFLGLSKLFARASNWFSMSAKLWSYSIIHHTFCNRLLHMCLHPRHQYCPYYCYGYNTFQNAPIFMYIAHQLFMLVWKWHYAKFVIFPNLKYVNPLLLKPFGFL